MRSPEPMATRRIPRLPLLALALAIMATAGALLASLAQAQSSGPFTPECLGSAKLGEERAEGEVAYRIACNTKVAGYTIIALDRQIDAFDTEPVVLDDADAPVLGEAFTCSALIPGFGVSCVGTAGVWGRATGAINLTTDPCKGPRPRFGFVVASEKGATFGPYRLMSAKPGPAGRPISGCPPAAAKAKRRSGPR